MMKMKRIEIKMNSSMKMVMRIGGEMNNSMGEMMKMKIIRYEMNSSMKKGMEMKRIGLR